MLAVDCLNVTLMGLALDISGAAVLIAGLVERGAVVSRTLVNTTFMGAPSNTAALLAERAWSWADTLVGTTLLVLGFVGQAIGVSQATTPSARAYLVAALVAVAALLTWRILRRPLAHRRGLVLALVEPHDGAAITRLRQIAHELRIVDSFEVMGDGVAEYAVATTIWGRRLQPSTIGARIDRLLNTTTNQRKQDLIAWVEEMKRRQAEQG